MSGAQQWQLEGHAAELYERYAARYILGPWAPGLVQIAKLREGERVLDLACGTGVVARIAAERAGVSGHVTGLDLNAGMLTVARALPPPAGAPVIWIERSALDTGLAAESFDVILCQQGFQFFPDKATAVREMRRVLAPGGRVAISVWSTTGLYNSAVGEALKRHVAPGVASRFLASRAAPAAHELVECVTAGGLEDVTLHIQRMTVHLPPPEEFVPAHLAATPVAADMRMAGRATGVAVAGDVARALAQYRESGGIAFPEEVNVITARKGRS